jgi:hypothetical protein
MMKCYSKLTYVMGAMADDLEFGLESLDLLRRTGLMVFLPAGYGFCCRTI